MNMRNYKINPSHITDLVNLSTTAFAACKEVIDDDISTHPSQKAEYMHFVSDILSDLIKTAYPLEKVDTKRIDDVARLENLFKQKPKDGDIVTIKCGQKGRVFGELGQGVYLLESGQGGQIITFKLEDIVSIGRV